MDTLDHLNKRIRGMRMGPGPHSALTLILVFSRSKDLRRIERNTL